MSGVAVLRYLLANNAAVIAEVDAEQIMAGVLPLETPMPAIGITQVSGVRRLTAAMTGTRMVTERVQVTVQAAPDQYPALKSILALVRTACANQHGTVNTVELDSILPDIEGPDLMDPDTWILYQSQDFIVKWRET